MAENTNKNDNVDNLGKLFDDEGGIDNNDVIGHHDENAEDALDNDDIIGVLGATEHVVTRSSEEHHSHHHSHHHGHHHRHRHHSSRHHSKKRSTSNNDGNKLKKYLKKNKKQILWNICVIIVAAILICIAFFTDKKVDVVDDRVNTELSLTDSSLKIELPLFSEEITLARAAVVEIAKSSITVEAKDIVNKYRKEENLDKALPVEFFYNIDGLPFGYSLASAKLEISEHEDFSDAIIYFLEGNNSNIDVYNLKTNVDYNYRLTLLFSNNTTTSVSGKFKTADTPRLLMIDGISNARDFGGWDTSSGKVINQGLLYRGSELDGVVEPLFCLTEAGVEAIRNLGIKTDMDLRGKYGNSIDESAIGEDVKHVYYDAPTYTDVFMQSNYESVRHVFSDLANKDNYPVYLHCTYGRDRTGTVCYLLGALLGVSEDDLLRDYRLSALEYGVLSDTEMSRFITTLNTYEGETLSQKTENFLLSIGVTVEEMNSLRSIFLGA